MTEKNVGTALGRAEAKSGDHGDANKRESISIFGIGKAGSRWVVFPRSVRVQALLRQGGSTVWQQPTQVIFAVSARQCEVDRTGVGLMSLNDEEMVN